MRMALMSIILVAGCVSVSKTVLMDRSTAPVPPTNVFVFLANDSIPQDCQRVAILHGSGSQDYTDEGDMLKKLREEAGKLGANAIHMQSMEDAGTGERVVSALFGTSSDRDAEALALFCPSNPGGVPPADTSDTR